MNKLYKTVFILLAVFCTAIFLGCANDGEIGQEWDDGKGLETQEPETPEIPEDFEGDFDMPILGKFEDAGLSIELEKQIILDYIDSLRSWEFWHLQKDEPWFEKPETVFFIREYYGTYNGCVVVDIAHPTFFPPGFGIPGIKWTIIIGGIDFSPPGLSPSTWKEGKIYPLQGAYELGFLTLEDLANIRGIDIRLGKFEDAGLSAKMEEQILLDYLDIARSSEDWSDFSTERWFENPEEYFWVTSYFGTYNDCVVVSIWDPSLKLYSESVWLVWNNEETNEEIIFAYGSFLPRIVWKEGTFYSLQEAYDFGLLTAEEIRNNGGTL